MSEKTVTVQIEVQLYEKLEALAKKLGRTPDDLAEEAFREVMADPAKYLRIKH